MNTYKSFQYSFLCLMFTCLSAFAQSRQDTIQQIEKIFSRYQSQNPGCQLSVSKGGVVIFSKAWGVADLEHNITLTTHSPIEAGSVSKQFTAAAILLLEQQGKLALEDDIRKYIPELPDYGTVIKVKHLIHHTSGLKDWGTIAELTGWERGTKTYRNEDALEICARQKTLNNVPGAEFVYSNSNYNLMAILVQRTSGLSLAEYTQKYIFIPAGMTHTQWRDNFKRIVKDRAIAYQKSASVYETDMPNEYVYGNGGLLTTTEDLLKWNDYYLSGKLGSPSLLAKQIALDKFNNGRPNFYGAGLNIQTVGGLNVIRHSGATASYRSYLAHYPQLKVSIAWLSNTSEFDGSEYNVTYEVEKLFIKQSATNTSSQSTSKDKTPTVLPAKLKEYEGWYRNNRTGYGMQILLKDEMLVADNRTPLIPVKDGMFKLGGDMIYFDKTKAFKLINYDNDTTSYTPELPANLTLQTGKTYTGTYFSDETQSGMTVVQKTDSLMLTLNSYTSYLLKPTYKDAFRIMDFGGVACFERDSNNNIIRMKIYKSRARNVEFVKTTK